MVIPSVVSKDKESATEIMVNLGLEVQIKEVSNDDYAVGLVIMQVPEAGETVQKGSPVQLLVSTGAKKQEMPILAGATSSDAITLLKNMGITQITTVMAVSAEFAPDTVISCEPAAGATVDKDTEVIYFKSDSHPLNYLRANICLQQFDQFYETYGVQEGDKMYLAPENRIAIW